MDRTIRPAEDLGRLLAAAEDASPVDAVEAVTRELGAALSATCVSFLIADLSGRAVVRMLQDDACGNAGDRLEMGAVQEESAPSQDPLALDHHGPAERALRKQTVQVIAPDSEEPGAELARGWTVLAPVTERGEALGLLELSLPHQPDAAALDEITRTAHILAFVLLANRRHTDLFEVGQRSTTFTLPAEIQRRLLPGATTCEAGTFTLSAWLEPAASIGGDSFDYNVSRDFLDLTLTDAMGHGLASALTATLCVGSLRNSRRKGATPLEQGVAANAALIEFGAGNHDSAFATGLLGRVHLASGVLEIVNAGHSAPFLARDDDVGTLALQVGLPLGVFADAELSVSELTLTPGDRLVLVTDGMLERNAEGLDLEAEIMRTRKLHPREATRALADCVLERAGGDLQDDAALLILDWHGQNDAHRDDRASVAGADATD